ncbi:sensor histidine kinase [Duganella vulcania]|uniref:Sensor histidine kinase n=1 Tax=Duganella vulcania TaxID=2692166 RepID=A0A845GI02_9BURK|nr:histidine kinase [Duganella vulcania]MYM94203.1 sensor histidine kinase [Duganella vulcania]
MNHRSTQAPPMAHPLDLMPFFRRWPSSTRRNLLYTLIWNLGLATVLTAVEMHWSNYEQPVVKHWLPMLLITNLIGFLIHFGNLLANAVSGGWPRRARGLPRMVFSSSLVVVCVPLGLGIGNALLSGKSVFQFMANRDALVQTLVVAAAVALLMYLVSSSAERKVAQAMEKARQQELIASSARMLAEARLRALQAQIEPHFLYNTLANVVSLIGPQPAKAQHMLERFIDYLRASLAASRSEEATLGSEARLIAAYLDVLAVRMGERLRYRIEVPDRLRQFAIAPMLLQPVVENAISHGLEPKVEGGEIVVSAVELGEHLCVQISDTGVGLGSTMSAKPGGGVGLSNLRERLRSLYGGAARVELLENQPCGMMVRLMLPLNASPTSIHSEH